jgi:hypothetical protein
VCLGRDERCARARAGSAVNHSTRSAFTSSPQSSVQAELARDLVERRCMALAVLPQAVECRKMKVECPHLSHKPAEQFLAAATALSAMRLPRRHADSSPSSSPVR